ncbi:hypothetical protein VCSRO103_3521 [Vibrio cholerae]|nr:hypothetical protein VCSRO103_3521 [Vibrio cholerae]
MFEQFILSSDTHNARLSGEQRNTMFLHTTLITKINAWQKCHALRIRLKAFVKQQFPRHYKNYRSLSFVEANQQPVL